MEKVNCVTGSLLSQGPAVDRAKQGSHNYQKYRLENRPLRPNCLKGWTEISAGEITIRRTI